MNAASLDRGGGMHGCQLGQQLAPKIFVPSQAALESLRSSLHHRHGLQASKSMGGISLSLGLRSWGSMPKTGQAASRRILNQR